MKKVVNEVAETFGLTKKLSTEIVDVVIEEIVARIKSGEKLRVKGFGIFGLKEKPARKGRNPKTGDEITIDAKTVVTFKMAKELKDSL